MEDTQYRVLNDSPEEWINSVCCIYNDVNLFIGMLLEIILLENLCFVFVSLHYFVDSISIKITGKFIHRNKLTIPIYQDSIIRRNWSQPKVSNRFINPGTEQHKV